MVSNEFKIENRFQRVQDRKRVPNEKMVFNKNQVQNGNQTRKRFSTISELKSRKRVFNNYRLQFGKTSLNNNQSLFKTFNFQQYQNNTFKSQKINQLFIPFNSLFTRQFPILVLVLCTKYNIHTLLCFEH